MMSLTDEDTLRLNVLLMQNIHALRIDESRMQILALTDKGEARIQLSRPSRDSIYLRQVREVIADHVMDLPGGYPVFLDRWTRSSQHRDDQVVKNLLLLGEPEAVVAVVHAPEITPDIARNAWWAMQDAENARCLLANQTIVQSELGKELADFLFEFLAFETEPRAIVNSVRLILQPGLYDDGMLDKLWQWAQRKATINIGLLQAIPDTLPDQYPAHPMYDDLNTSTSLVSPELSELQKVLSAQGQTFLATANLALKKLADQETAMALFDVVGDYFSAWQLPLPELKATDQACTETLRRIENNELPRPVLDILEQYPGYRSLIKSALVLGQMNRQLLISFFSRSTMVGSLMRRKLGPWTEPLQRHINQLTHLEV
jgi:hypothetical protein